jgi:hypothetical protein
MTDPKAQAEVTSVLANMGGAARRARKVGPRNAFGDKQVADQLRRASTHAAQAFAFARRGKRRRSLAAPLRGTVVAGALTGAAYIGVNRYLGLHTRSLATGHEQKSSGID